MPGSFRIGSIFGITIRVHWLFPALVLLFLLPASQQFHPLILLAVPLALFAVVLLHELGHSLVAQHFGIRVLDITFWPLGGMARMSEIPENSRIEALIAIAGPLVNFVLAALSLPLYLGFLALETGGEMAAATPLASAAGFFLWMNLVLGGFNLIPAFPMDGGRILRAFLGRGGDWVRATERAVKVGRFFAILMVIAGFWNPLTGRGNLMLPLIGVFIWFAGARELFAVRMRRARNRVGSPGDLLRAMFHRAPEAPTQSARAASPTPQAPRAPRAPRPPQAGDFLRTPPEEPEAGPWTEDAIRALEQFPGRLRNFRREAGE